MRISLILVESTLRKTCTKHLPLGFIPSPCYPLMLHAHICFLHIQSPIFSGICHPHTLTRLNRPSGLFVFFQTHVNDETMS
jgi:hypothetical protein